MSLLCSHVFSRLFPFSLLLPPSLKIENPSSSAFSSWWLCSALISFFFSSLPIPFLPPSPPLQIAQEKKQAAPFPTPQNSTSLTRPSQLPYSPFPTFLLTYTSPSTQPISSAQNPTSRQSPYQQSRRVHAPKPKSEAGKMKKTSATRWR